MQKTEDGLEVSVVELRRLKNRGCEKRLSRSTGIWGVISAKAFRPSRISLACGGSLTCSTYGEIVQKTLNLGSERPLVRTIPFPKEKQIRRMPVSKNSWVARHSSSRSCLRLLSKT